MTVKELRELLEDHGPDLEVVLVLDEGSGEKRYGLKPDTDRTDSWEQGYEMRLLVDVERLVF